MPIKEEGYILNKQLFWDLLRIRYGWMLTRLPNDCEGGALSCKKGGFLSLRHNHLRNITSSLLQEVCKDVSVEPHLQKLSGETFEIKTTAMGDEARLGIAAREFWQAGQLAFWVFNPNTKRYAKM